MTRILCAFVLLALGAAKAEACQRTELSAPRVDPDETFEVSVLLRAQRRFEDDAPAAEGIRIAVGVGREGDAPRYSDREVLARATSGEDGRVAVTLHVPKEWKDAPDAWIWARVETPGFRERVARRALKAPEDDLTKVMVYPGGTLYGTVVTGDGAPVEGARVWSVRRGEAGASCRSQDESDAAGRFAVEVFEAGRHAIHARASGLGSGTSPSLQLDPHSMPAEWIEVEVGGGTVVDGRVVDPRGESVAGMSVLAIPAGRSAFPEWEECVEREVGGGLFGDLTRTDREGRIRFPALVPGEYACFGSWSLRSPDGFGTKAKELGEPIGMLSVGAPGEPQDLVFRQRRIELKLLDARGEPPDWECNAKRPWRDCALTVEVRDELYSWQTWRRVGDIVVVPVEPDVEYCIAWQDPAYRYAERSVVVPWEHFRVPIELRLGEQVEGAELSVRVLTPDGKPLGDGDDEPHVFVLSPDSGRTVALSQRPGGLFGTARTKVDGWKTTLPPGRYLVRATSDPVYGCIVPHPYPRTPYCPAEAIVELEAGRTSDVELSFGRSGHLDFLATGVPARARPIRHEELSPIRVVNLWEMRGKFGGGFASFEPRGRERIERLEFDIPGALGRADWILPGWDARCLTPLPPGPGRLRVEGEEGVLYEGDVVVREGEVTVVRW